MPKKVSSASKAKKQVKKTGPEEALKSRISLLEKEVRILREVSEVTSKDFNINKVLERFLQMLMDATDSEAGSLLLIDKVTDTLYFAVAKGKKADKLKDYRLTIGEGIAGWVAQTGRPLVTPNVEREKKFSSRIDRALNNKTKNIVCAPIKYEDEVLGVVELLNKRKGEAYGEADLVMLQNFTPYIGMIIKNAQLFLENRTRIDRLEHLIEVTKHVNSNLDLSTLLDTMLEISTHMLGAEAGSILLLDEKRDELVFSAATGGQIEKLRSVKVPVGEGIAGWVAREDESVLVADAQNDPRFYKKADEKTAFKTKSIIAVPLKTKSKLIGVLEVLNKKDGSMFNEEDKSLLEALSNQAAVAIENAKLYTVQKDMFLNTVHALATAIDTKDRYTRGHSDGVTNYSVLIGKAMDFDSRELEDLRIAALFHDIGKIGIDESILRKPGKLTEQEFEEIKKHPDYGANILESIPQLRDIIPVVRHHHERFDGNGYPMGLRGDAIPLNARIISVADTFDAMSTDRPYRKGLPVNTCLEEIKRCAGTQFDPEIAGIAVATLKKNFSEKKK